MNFSSVVAGVIRNEIFFLLDDIPSNANDALSAIVMGNANKKKIIESLMAWSVGTPLIWRL